MKNCQQKNTSITEESHAIIIKNLKPYKDTNSQSGKSNKLLKGKAEKLYPKEGTSNGKGKSEYYYKPSGNLDNDACGVILSRELKHVFKCDNNIEICKQTLKKIGDKDSDFSKNKFVVVSKATSHQPFITPKALWEEANNNNNLVKILGAEMIYGNADWNPANYGINSERKIVKIDIDSPYMMKKPFRGSFVGMEILIYLVIKSDNYNDINIKHNKYEDFKFILKLLKKQCATRSHKEFIMNTRSIKLITTTASQEDGEALQVNEICKKIQQALNKTNEGDKLFKQLCAYIDGAVEFYYRAPYAKIEERYIVGMKPDQYRTELRKLQDESFNDFLLSIYSFKNEKLTAYFTKKNQEEIQEEMEEFALENKQLTNTKNVSNIEEDSGSFINKIKKLDHKFLQDLGKSEKNIEKTAIIEKDASESYKFIAESIKTEIISPVNKSSQNNDQHSPCANEAKIPTANVSNPTLIFFYGKLQRIKGALMSCFGGR